MMINEGLIGWLVTGLKNYHVMSDYMLEYSIALLMNLIIQSYGRLGWSVVILFILMIANSTKLTHVADLEASPNGTEVNIYTYIKNCNYV